MNYYFFNLTIYHRGGAIFKNISGVNQADDALEAMSLAEESCESHYESHPSNYEIIFNQFNKV